MIYRSPFPCLADVVVAHVPVCAMPYVETSAVLLYDHARYHVFEGLAEIVEFLHASVANSIYPLGNLMYATYTRGNGNFSEFLSATRDAARSTGLKKRRPAPPCTILLSLKHTTKTYHSLLCGLF